MPYASAVPVVAQYGDALAGKVIIDISNSSTRAFWLNARGTLFTVQKALPLINDNGSILMTGSNASLGAFPGWSLYAGSKAVQQAWARVWRQRSCATARSASTS